MIGKTVGGYQILEQIGEGGMATVYKAYDEGTDRHVAIKTLPPRYADDPEFVKRFEIEARAIARLEHLHILPIFAYSEDDGVTYMAMRYMDTGTLTDYLSQQTLSFAEIARLLKQIASVLDYAHRQQIIHRDVKPSNILLDDNPNAFLHFWDCQDALVVHAINPNRLTRWHTTIHGSRTIRFRKPNHRQSRPICA